MNHLSEAHAVALRDDQLTHGEARAHLAVCASCAAAVEEARERALIVAEALAALDDGPVDVEAAKHRVRQRLDEEAAAASRRTTGGVRGVDLRRAAVILLVTAGAASALPGSPLYRLLSPGDRSDGPVTTHGAPAEGASLQAPPSAGVTVAVPAGGVRVLLRAEGTLDGIEVVWADEPLVRVDAPAGSRFIYGEGRVEATLAGGPLRMTLPRSGEPVHVELEGRTILSRTQDGLAVEAPVLERSDARLLLARPRP